MTGKSRRLARIAVLFCVTALMAFAGIAQANTEGWDGHCGMHQKHHFMKVAKKLGLTDAQKAQAKAIFKANWEVVKPIVANMHAERKNLMALIHADAVDEAAIRAESAKIASIMADLNVNKAKVHAQFRAILTPEQLATLKTLHQKHHQKDDAATTATPGV